MTAEERAAYVAALPDAEKDALRALLVDAPALPAPAPEELVAEIRTKLRRLALQKLATRMPLASGPAPVEQPIASMKDRTHGHDSGEARVA
jgi:hypothetical protein